jgi:hypothetical protein
MSLCPHNSTPLAVARLQLSQSCACWRASSSMRCFQRNFEARDAKRRGEFREAEYWIFHDKGDEDGPFSFEDVCTALEIDPRRLRDLIVRWEEDTPAADRQRTRRSIVNPPAGSGT